MDADLTLAEAATVLDPPLTVKQLREIIRALGWQPASHRYTGRAGHPSPAYPAEAIMKLHRALVDSGSIELFFGRATHPRATMMATPEFTVSTTDGHVTIEAADGVVAHMTADQACELAADLLTHANALRQPSEEDKIRDAMTEATDHPGRIVTR